MIQATTSEIVYDSNGQHFIEKGNPNNIMTMNSSGLLLSTDGGMTAKTAITARGITADAITTGTMYANRIQGGSLASNNGSMVWNLDKNEFNYYSGATTHYYGSSSIQFHTTDNVLFATIGPTTAFMKFMPSYVKTIPSAVFGVSESGISAGGGDFAGFKAHSRLSTPDGLSSGEVFGDLITFDSHGGIKTTGAWIIETYRKNGDKTRSFYGPNTSLGYQYELGKPLNPFQTLWARNLLDSMRLVSNTTDDSGSILSMDLRNGTTFSNSGLKLVWGGKSYTFGWILQELQRLSNGIVAAQKRIDSTNQRIDVVLQQTNDLKSQLDALSIKVAKLGGQK